MKQPDPRRLPPPRPVSAQPVAAALVLALAAVGAAGAGAGPEAVPERTAEGFRVPQPGAVLEFPRDHGSHPDFKIEWWYLTGHLRDADGREFGFQATFFRLAGPPVGEEGPGGAAAAESGPDFGAAHLHLGHMAWTDVAAGRYRCEERLQRDGWDAGAAVGRLDVRQADWRLEMVEAAAGRMRLAGSVRGEVRWTLDLAPRKPLVRFGPDGTSRKGADPAARSYYLSFTRLAAAGTYREGAGPPVAVAGEAWMDHEIASQQLGDDLAGWDWTAIQLDDGTEIKAYLLRRADGTADPHSALITIDAAGVPAYHGPAAFRWTPERTWTSPATGAAYPVEITLDVPGGPGAAPRRLRLVPVLDAQEFAGRPGGLAYWEGACRVLDSSGRPLGRAYLELVGYAPGGLQGRLR